MDNNVKPVNKKKSSVFAKQRNTIIAIAVIFALLLCAYLFIIRPLLSDDSGDTVSEGISLIWENEVRGMGSTVLMFEHIERNSISEINIHNPALVSYGKQYVDWSVYRAAKNETVGKYPIEKGSFYLKGYEYAPINDNDTSSVLASIINDAGYTLAISRAVDHTDDFSKYGLDFETEEDATYCEIVTLSGESYKFYVGDKIPSGSAYYVRVAGNSVCTDKNSEFYGKEIPNDSVYIYDCANVLISPTDAISPILTYPLDASMQSYFDMFSVIEYTGTGEDDSRTKIQFFAINDDYKHKPISTFAPMTIYYTTIPDGHYSSDAFENLFENFTGGLQGAAVKELSVLKTKINEETGKEEHYYGFEDGILDKYFGEGPAYTLAFSWNGIGNIIDVSHMTENGTYYVLSNVYNTICEVNAETLSFLTWDLTTYIQKEMFQMQITSCAELAIKGKYNDVSLIDKIENGEKLVDTLFKLEVASDESIKVTSETSKDKGNMTEKEWADNFRTLYQILLFSYIKEPVDSEKAKEIMQGEAFAEIRIKTFERNVYKTNESGEETAVVDYTVASMTRVFRFYKFSSGRCLMTIESIDENGESSGESGSFYLSTARIELVLKSAEKVANAEIVSKHERE